MAHVGPCDLQALRRTIDSNADQVAGGIEIGLQDVGGRRVRAMAAKLAQMLADVGASNVPVSAAWPSSSSEMRPR